MRRALVSLALCLWFAPALQAQPEKKADLLGDPLPAGVAIRLGTTRLRHAGAIHATAWTPDGKLLASAGEDQLIRLWDPVTGKEIRQMKAGAAVTALAFFKDGKSLVSADVKGDIRSWDVESGREIRRFGNSKYLITCLALSPDNATLYSADAKGIHQWLGATGIKLKEFPAQKGKILAMAVSADGKELRIAADDGFARVFDTTTGLETRSFPVDSKRGVGIEAKATFSRGGKLVACTRPNDAPGLFDADTGKLLRSFGNRALRVTALDFSPSGKYVAASVFSGGVRVFGVASGQELRAFDGPLNAPRGVLAFSPDGEILAAAAGDHALGLWHVADARDALPLPGHPSAVQSMCFSRDGAVVFTAANDRAIRAWDRATGKEIARYEPKIGFAQQLSVGAGPRSFILGGYDGACEWAVKDSRITQVRKWDQLKSLTGVAMSRDGKKLAVAGDSAISVLDAASGKILIKLVEPRKGVAAKAVYRNLDFSPDGQLLAASLLDSSIQVWHVATGRLVRKVNPRRGAIWKTFAFSPDGRLLVAVASDDILIYEIATGQIRQHMAQKQAVAVRTLTYSPNGRQVVAGMFRGGVKIFDVRTGEAASQLDGGDEVRALAVSPDGATLASAGGDTSVLLWAKAPWREPAPPGAPLRLERAEIEVLWKLLGQPDGLRAHQAIWALAAASTQTVPFLKENMKPDNAPTPRQIEQHIRDLSSSNFGVRQKATRELEKLGTEIEPSLRAAMTESLPLETRRRIEELLTRLKDMPSPEKLQLLRALEVLEHAQGEESRRVLASLADGDASHWLTDSARRTLERLRRHETHP